MDGCGGEHIFLVVGERQSTIVAYLRGVVGAVKGEGNWKLGLFWGRGWRKVCRRGGEEVRGEKMERGRGERCGVVW